MNRSARRQKLKDLRQRTTLEQHHRQGKTLIPPMANLGMKMRHCSWIHDRMPEMLWSILLAGLLPRDAALDTFRRVGFAISKHDVASERAAFDLTHSGIAAMSPALRSTILAAICHSTENRHVLQCLRKVPEMPGFEFWSEFLTADSLPLWEPIQSAVARTLDHQSQFATDVRWARVAAFVLAGKLKFPTADLVKEILDYPNYGDQRKVRPSIRAAEIAIGQMNDKGRSPWVDLFWQLCQSRTPCVAIEFADAEVPAVGVTRANVDRMWHSITECCNSSRKTTEPDAKHDVVFGTALYSLTLLRELLGIRVSQSVLGVLALRTLAEACINLAYLYAKSDLSLWKSFRVYGSGQAKLLSLKIDGQDASPLYVDSDSLQALVNEDIWEEFLPIELGHWDKSNLRSMSEYGGVKDLWDKYYQYPSTFVHGHWNALRNTVFNTCANPLHRLHRIPSPEPNSTNDVLSDAVVITNRVLDFVNKCYPPFPARF